MLKGAGDVVKGDGEASNCNEKALKGDTDE